MDFWGVEVKAGQPLKVQPGYDRMIHLSQASLGVSKKDNGNDSVPLFLKIDFKKFVLGTLSSVNFPQISFDLVFEKEFELSHNWKNGSVYFCGYKADIQDESSDFSMSEDEVDLPSDIAPNGKPDPKVEKAKPATAKDNDAKPNLTPLEPKKYEKSDDDDESDDVSDVPAELESEDSDDSDDIDDSDESLDEETMDEDEETPKKAESGKKRPTESATKTPVPAKKVKLATPQKTDGKKGCAHTDTPYPSKQPAKTPANSEKSKTGTPKSAGPVTCNSCSKKFNSEGALQSHAKAKHEGK